MKFSIEAFIENRWAEAKIELERICPAFVKSLQTYDALMKRGFVLPESLPVPEQRLPVTWHELLETTYDVTQAIQRIDTALELLEGNSDRRLARFFYEVWAQSAYNLCEKIESLIAHACKIHSINRRTKTGYYRLLKDVQNEIEKRRTAIVHGANRPKGNATPINATAITEDGLWEGGVHLGPEIMKVAIEQSYQTGHFTPRDIYVGVKGATEVILNRLGKVDPISWTVLGQC